MDNSEIQFEISIDALYTHTYKVKCVLKAEKNTSVVFSMPSWTPGSYLIREFAQHVSAVKAFSSKNALTIKKIDKDTWTCIPDGPELCLEYEVYAFDSSIRAAFLDDSYGFFSGTSLFMRIAGRENSPHTITLKKSANEICQNFRVATSMTPRDVDSQGFGIYHSNDYDELVDHPVLMSDHDKISFEARGIPHHIIVTPKIFFDKNRLAQDCQKICETHLDLFGAPAPFGNYFFLLRAEEDGYGGLEHRASSALLCKITDLPLCDQKTHTDGYRELLGLISHEYFHAWNIKRMKPLAFNTFDYNRENYTDLLWFFEGFTSYYDDLALVRSQVISVDAYLDGLAHTLSRVQGQSGRLKQTLAEASFDAWIKFYRPNENSSNSHVSYYQKGTLVALALDLAIRKDSKHAHSVDDLMQGLWKKFGRQSKGLTEADIIDEVNFLTQSNFSNFFATSIHSTEDLELDELFENFGIKLLWESKHIEEGGFDSYLGCSLKADGNHARIVTILDNSPARQAGLCPGDIIIALNNFRVSASSFDSQLARNQPGEKVTIHAFRRGMLRSFQAQISENPKTTCVLKKIAKPSKEQISGFNAWLHVKP